MRAIFFDPTGGLDLTPDINLIAESAKSGENFIWFDFEAFTDKDLKFLQKLFGLHNLAIEDCQSSLHQPKIDFYPDQSFIVWNYPAGEISNHFEIRSIQFFMGKNYLVSLHKDKMPELDTIYQEYSSDPKLIQKGSQWLFHVIIDNI